MSKLRLKKVKEKIKDILKSIWKFIKSIFPYLAKGVMFVLDLNSKFWLSVVLLITALTLFASPLFLVINENLFLVFIPIVMYFLSSIVFHYSKKYEFERYSRLKSILIVIFHIWYSLCFVLAIVMISNKLSFGNVGSEITVYLALLLTGYIDVIVSWVRGKEITNHTRIFMYFIALIIIGISHFTIISNVLVDNRDTTLSNDGLSVLINGVWLLLLMDNIIYMILNNRKDIIKTKKVVE